jgi:hypothetical protein
MISKSLVENLSYLKCVKLSCFLLIMELACKWKIRTNLEACGAPLLRLRCALDAGAGGAHSSPPLFFLLFRSGVVSSIRSLPLELSGFDLR